MIDFSLPGDQSQISFFDTNINSVIITNTLFHHLNALDTAIIYVSNDINEFEVICVSDTFQYLRSEVGTCAIKLVGSNSSMKSLCFSDIEAKYIGASYNCGTCVSLKKSYFDLSSLSMIRTNFLNHASIHFEYNTIGNILKSNSSYGKTYNAGATVSGIVFYQNTKANAAFLSLAHFDGGHSILALSEVQSLSHHLIFINITADEKTPLLFSESQNFHLDDSACISCGPLIALCPVPFRRWYFVDCEPDPNYFTDIQLKYKKFQIIINMKCNIMKTYAKSSLTKKFLCMTLFLTKQV